MLRGSKISGTQGDKTGEKDKKRRGDKTKEARQTPD